MADTGDTTKEMKEQIKELQAAVRVIADGFNQLSVVIARITTHAEDSGKRMEKLEESVDKLTESVTKVQLDVQRQGIWMKVMVGLLCTGIVFQYQSPIMGILVSIVRAISGV